MNRLLSAGLGTLCGRPPACSGSAQQADQGQRGGRAAIRSSSQLGEHQHSLGGACQRCAGRRGSCHSAVHGCERSPIALLPSTGEVCHGLGVATKEQAYLVACQILGEHNQATRLAGGDSCSSKQLFSSYMVPKKCAGVRTGELRWLCCAPAQAGLDSLGAVELRNAVSSTFGIAAPASLAFDNPTQEALASFINIEVAARAVMTRPSEAITTPHQRKASTTTDIVGVACQYPAAEATGRASVLLHRLLLCPAGQTIQEKGASSTGQVVR